MKFLRRRRAHRRIILAARLVESGYEPDLDHQHDPDDLAELREAVRELRALDGAQP